MSSKLPPVAIIGGTGLDNLPSLPDGGDLPRYTPYGSTSDALRYGTISGKEVIFLPRHGSKHRIPPHRINYRANMYALHQAGVKDVISVSAVGSMDSVLTPGSIGLPDQIVDYTYGRQHTFSDGGHAELLHVEFDPPYNWALRKRMLAAAARVGIPVVNGGVYACTQGPRLETAAEIRRLQRDGCTMVGMTGMPEAALARELGLNYVCLAAAVNWAAGMPEADNEGIHAQIEDNVKQSMARVIKLFTAILAD